MRGQLRNAPALTGSLTFDIVCDQNLVFWSCLQGINMHALLHRLLRQKLLQGYS